MTAPHTALNADGSPAVRKTAMADVSIELVHDGDLYDLSAGYKAWWQKWVEPYRDQPDEDLTVRFLPGRLRFIKPGATEVKPNERPPFGCCLLMWSR